MVCHKETYEKLLNEQKSKYYIESHINNPYICVVESIGFKLNGSENNENPEDKDEILNESMKGKIKQIDETLQKNQVAK